MPVHYAEVIATAASLSIGPGTRQNVDEFVQTTALAIRKVGGAATSRAVPVFNPANPPINMTNTVYAVIKEDFDEKSVIASIKSIADEITGYVPGYRLKGDPLVDYRDTPWGHLPTVVIMNEVIGSGDFFPTYAGNLDIMTASACRVRELYAQHLLKGSGGRKMTKLRLTDTTLKDGSHAVSHSFTTETVRYYFW